MNQSIASKFSFDEGPSEEAKIAIVGVGGGGGNAINNMLEKGIHGVEFIAVNTDAQALSLNRSPTKVQAGRSLTKGLGAGARPSIGAEAVEENRTEIEQALEGYDMVFITAGMGGGTGTGGAPVVAAIARKLGILSVAVVTRPFVCEGRRRTDSAMEGINILREQVDTLIIIPNERLLDIADESTSLLDAFAAADEVLYNATRGISDLITVHGLINLDFADVKTTMEHGGTALMGAASAEGEGRAEKAAIEAISSPLLDGLSIAGARNVLVNITAGRSLGIREATKAISVIQQEAGDDVEVIFGTVIDDEMGEEFRVTVIATGFDRPRKQENRRRTVSLIQPEPIHYKGEDSLRQLDIPTFERRGMPLEEPAERAERREGKEEAPNRKVRRLQIDELRERPDRSRKDNADSPAFLRKMMD